MADTAAEHRVGQDGKLQTKFQTKDKLQGQNQAPEQGQAQSQTQGHSQVQTQQSAMKRPDSHGKVRDIYDCGDTLLMVASDRISAFDFILPDEIPHKGEVLTRISAFWFDRFKDLIPSHLLSCDVADLPEEFAPYTDYLRGRCMLVKKAKTIPIECIVRGYLTGSGKKTYDKDQTVCGITLPEGLTEASKLPEPLFTPSTKAALGDHDENISFERCAELVGQDLAEQLRDASLAIYNAAASYAAEQGIIIADTKFEFGLIDNQLTLIDECLTPDSSRFWPADGYVPGQVQPSYDKQFVRDWLSANWDMQGEPPHLPLEIRDGTSKRYEEAFGIIVGQPFIAEGDAH